MEPKLNLTIKRVDSVREILEQARDAVPTKHAFEYRENGGVKSVTYSEFYNEALYMCNAVKARGFESGHHIACVGNNSYRWLVAFLSTLCSNNIFVPVDKDLPEEDLKTVISHSDSSVVFCESKYYDTVKSLADAEGKIKMIICLDGDKGVAFETMMSEGKALFAKGMDEFPEIDYDMNSLKMLVYTSGTTGNPKGVMLSEFNIISMVFYGMQVQVLYDRCLSVLPYNHTYESVVGIVVSLHNHTTICINESLRAVLPNLNLFKPEYMFVVPAFAELFYKRVWANIEEKGKTGLIKKMIKLSNKLRKIGIDKRRTFFKQIHAAFGGELRLIVCGGAPIRPEVGQFFTDIGIDLLNGYGITECSPLISVNQQETNDYASVGVLIPSLKLKIEGCDENGNGEICVKGKNVMKGYYKQPEETAAVIKNGWFHTGDLGHYTDGKLYITGRIKNLIVLANGKNIYPEEIENYITAIPYVKEAVVYSIKDEKGAETGLCAEIFPDYDALGTDDDKIAAKIKADVSAAVAALPSYKHISQVVVRKTEFPKTTSRKIKRREVIGK